MIKALPESFLPDEGDYNLYKHMESIRESQSAGRAAAESNGTKPFDSIASLDNSSD